MRRIVLPLVALLLAGATTMAVRSWLEGQKAALQTASIAAPAAVSTRNVLVAAESLGSGQFLRPELMRWQTWPDVELPESYVVEGGGTTEELTGTVVRRPIAEGEPINRVNIVRPGDRGFLAAVLDQGMRAVSVAVDEASSNAGLIFPGDRIDLVMSQMVPGVDGAPDRRFAQTVLDDVRVIALGNKLQVDGTAMLADAARTVTLEVTAAGAERVALAVDLGRLTLALRSLARADGGADPTAPHGTWDNQVSRALTAGPTTRKLTLIRGQQSTVFTPGTGATP